jgi:dTDP-4-amino-4,6-dideoxygalactose transaminase
VLDSGWYLRGEATRRFEEHYAEYIGTKHCVGVANGLDALTLILRAYKELGVMKDGDEVIVPANTFIATILAITDNNLIPVLVEPDINTFQIDDRLIEQAITSRTRAIMIVHLYGRCAYTDRIGELCNKYGLKLIEDNAQAHGCKASVQGSGFKVTGSIGDAAGHSFYPGKNLGALGDAGAVTTDDDDLSAMVRALGNYGSEQKYVHDYAGRNSRTDELQAAILDAKLCHLDADNQRRKEIASIYINKVKNATIVIPQSDRDCVWHIFPVLFKRRDELQRYLREHGVETQIHYPIPPHRQRCYAEWNHLSLPITEQISAQELSLPCNPVMTDEEANDIVALLNSF